MVVTDLAPKRALRRSVGRRKKVRRALELARAGDPIGAVKWLWSSFRDRWAPVRVVIRGHPVLLRTSSNDISIALQNLCGEFDEVVARVPVTTYGLIVDAGGYIGTAAIVFAEAYPDATVVTLEPSRENFALLLQNVAGHRNILPLNKALGGRAGEVELRDRGRGHAGLTLAEPRDGLGSPAIDRVERTTIEKLLNELGKAGIDVLKLDIEGGELELFSGDVSWMKRTRAICIELHDRIVPGCSALWDEVTAGRRNSKLEGEKYLSLAA